MKNELMQYLPDPNTFKDNMGLVIEKLQIEAPLLCEEIIRWAVCEYTAYLTMGAFLIALGFYFIGKAKKAVWYIDSRNHDNGRIMPWAAFAWAMIVGVGMVLGNTICLLKPLIAPKLFLIEYISKLF